MVFDISMMKKTLIINIAVFIIALILILFLLEISLRLFFPQDLNYFKLDETLGYKGIPNMKTAFRIPEFSTIVKLNEKGLRDYNHEYENNLGKYRILVLGDSMTFGYGVENNEAYPNVLENFLNEKESKYEIINAGVTGWNTAQELAFLETEGLNYNPNMVLLGIMSNDIPTNYLDKNIFLLENGKLVKNYPSYKFSLIQRVKNFLSSHSHLYNFIKTKTGLKTRVTKEKEEEKERVIKTALGIWDNTIDEAKEKTFLLLKEMKTVLDERGISLVVVIIPIKEHIDEKKLQKMLKTYSIGEEINISKYRLSVSDYLKSENIQYIDLFDPMKKLNKNNDFYYDYDGHLNKEGQTIVAKIIFGELFKQSLK